MKFYLALFTGFFVGTIRLLIDFHELNQSWWLLIVYIIIDIYILKLIRDQVGVTADEFLKVILHNKQQYLQYIIKNLKTEQDPRVRELVLKIYNNEITTIEEIQQLLRLLEKQGTELEKRDAELVNAG